MCVLLPRADCAQLLYLCRCREAEVQGGSRAVCMSAGHARVSRGSGGGLG